MRCRTNDQQNVIFTGAFRHVRVPISPCLGGGQDPLFGGQADQIVGAVSAPEALAVSMIIRAVFRWIAAKRARLI
jgi:hypothetical protein